MDWRDYYNFPVSYKRWLIERINKEISKLAEQSTIPTKAPHDNVPMLRALSGKTRQIAPKKLIRFT